MNDPDPEECNKSEEVNVIAEEEKEPTIESDSDPENMEVS